MNINSVTYLGHSALIFACGNKRVAIDPWLDGNPLCPEKFKKLTSLDLIILTHGHSDHAGDTPRLAKHTGATIIATWELAQLIVAEGVSSTKVIPMNKGGTVNFEGLKVTLTNAFHSSSFDTAIGPQYAGEPCGIVLQGTNTTVYHAGDTALFSDMKLIGEVYRPKIAFLPIGDRFTMGPKEAAMAAKLISPETAIPIHYKTFDMLTGTFEEFQKELGGSSIKTFELKLGEDWNLAG